jgi:hypothetical protein
VASTCENNNGLPGPVRSCVVEQLLCSQEEFSSMELVRGEHESPLDERGVINDRTGKSPGRF